MRRTTPITQAPGPKPQARAFTLVEMLVVAAITVLMFGIVGVVYRNVVDLISTGTATSEVLNNGQTAGEQIRDDTSYGKIIGPDESGDGGFLVIINQEIAAPVTEEDLEAGLARRVRSDQLLFFRDADNEMEPFTPGNTNSFSNTAHARALKVWYGHLRRTAPNGTDEADAGYTIGMLGQPDGTGAPEPGTNELASQWILGRQAMFLAGGDATPVHIDTDADGANIGGPWPNWPVVGGFTAPSVGWEYNGTAYGAMPWFAAGSDVIDKELIDSDNLADNNIIVKPPPPTAKLDQLYTGQSRQQYQQTALRYAYPVPYPKDPTAPPTGLDRYGLRLRVNPNPEIDPGGNPLSSRQIAQMHPYLAGNVTDFIVEFAADRDNDDEIDLYTAGPKQGEIIWYDANFEADGDAQMPTWTGGDAIAIPTHDPTDKDYVAAFVFRHDDTGDNSYWPYLIRIRYRLGDDDGDVGRRISGDQDGRDNDGDGTVDEADEASISTFEPGRWFERIIKVRPFD